MTVVFKDKQEWKFTKINHKMDYSFVIMISNEKMFIRLIKTYYDNVITINSEGQFLRINIKLTPQDIWKKFHIKVP